MGLKRAETIFNLTVQSRKYHRVQGFFWHGPALVSDPKVSQTLKLGMASRIWNGSTCNVGGGLS